ncbi:MAG: NADPH-dependent FMN reductase [Adhaeribacter sp.]
MAIIRKKILAVSGSLRSNSVNELLLSYLAERYTESLDIQVYNDLAELSHFNPDLDNETLPVSVSNFRAEIEAADGIIICTPEYVFSLPGVLKNALEWTVSTTIFSGKPVALIVASGQGEKAYEALILIMNTLGAKIGEHAKLLISGARSKIKTQGNISDALTAKELDTLMQSLLETITDKQPVLNPI